MSSLHYLKIVYGKCSQGKLVVTGQKGSRPDFIDVKNLRDASDVIDQRAQHECAYVTWAVLKETPNSGRGTAKDAFIMPGLMMDLDIKGDAHAETELPATREELHEWFASTGLPAPTAIRDSGNGIYYDWLFDQPYLIESPEDFKRIKTLSKRWQDTIREKAKQEKGWIFDSTGDLARITRLPGTKNFKDPGRPKDVVLLSCDPANKFDLSELENLLPSVSEVQKQKKQTLMSQTAKGTDTYTESAASFDAILEGCSFLRHCVDNAAVLPEPHWYAAASIVGNCENGKDIFQKMSQPYPQYDHEQTGRKLEQATSSANPRTCSNIESELGFSGCRSCLFRGRINSPIRLGFGGAKHLPAARALQSSYLFCLTPPWVIHLETREKRSFTSFNNANAHILSKASTRLMHDEITLKVDRTIYLPGVEEVFIAQWPLAPLFNTWQPGEIAPQTGDCSIILEHIEKLLPDEKDRDHLLDVLSHHSQNRGEKLKHAVVLIGKQGTGKSFLFALLKALYGRSNVAIRESSALASEWNAMLVDTEVLAIEELMAKGRVDIANNLKTLITEEKVIANQKFVVPYEASSPRLIFACSNHELPAYIEPTDRRYSILASPMEKQDQAYYDRLWKIGLNQAAAFHQYLLERDLSEFAPDAPPPVTLAKANAIAAQLPELEQTILQLMRDENEPFNKDVLTIAGLMEVLKDCVPANKRSMPQVIRTLKGLGAVSLPQTMLPGIGRTRLWAWRNQDRWLEALPAERAEEWFGKNRLQMVGA